MEPSVLATGFIERFCSGDVEGLESFLAEDLRFTGPFLTFESRQGYLQSLRQDPPAPCEHRIRTILSDGDKAAVFWDYGRGLDFVPMAQLFRAAEGRIQEILLVFDTAALLGPVVEGMDGAELP